MILNKQVGLLFIYSYFPKVKDGIEHVGNDRQTETRVPKESRK
jgi:hypothetical protein